MIIVLALRAGVNIDDHKCSESDLGLLLEAEGSIQGGANFAREDHVAEEQGTCTNVTRACERQYHRGHLYLVAPRLGLFGSFLGFEFLVFFWCRGGGMHEATSSSLAGMSEQSGVHLARLRSHVVRAVHPGFDFLRVPLLQQQFDQS